jgi:hypothetical protein
VEGGGRRYEGGGRKEEGGGRRKGERRETDDKELTGTQEMSDGDRIRIKRYFQGSREGRGDKNNSSIPTKIIYLKITTFTYLKNLYWYIFFWRHCPFNIPSTVKYFVVLSSRNPVL